MWIMEGGPVQISLDRYRLLRTTPHGIEEVELSVEVNNVSPEEVMSTLRVVAGRLLGEGGASPSSTLRG